MGRKRKEKQSTAMIIYNNSDWGKILFNACFIFNKRLADYWLEYINKYNNGEIKINDDNADDKIKNISQFRNQLVTNKNKLKDNVRLASIKVTKSYHNYVKSIPIGKKVKELRKSSINYELNPDYKKLNDYYFVKVQEENNAIEENKKYTCNHLFETRILGAKIRQIQKMVNIHNKNLAYPIINDKDILYNFITSEKQIEKLMSVCLNILDTYSNKDFTQIMNLQDKERIAESIFDYFNEYVHNYDFIAGCYELKDDNKLYLKDLETLSNKFYNGYYFTIRGFVQSAYVKARNEHYNIESSDNDNENNNLNSGIDKYTNINKIPLFRNKGFFDEGMIEFWKNCKDYLFYYHKNIAFEFHQKMNEQFEDLSSYYNQENTQKIILEIINGINLELEKGRILGNKFKYIILDSTRGAETKQEWQYSTKIMSVILKKYMNKFFKENLKELTCK